MSGQLILSGGDAEADIVFKKSEVNHLRLLLAWMRCEYMLDEDMQRGYAEGAMLSVKHGLTTQESAENQLAEKAEEVRHVPLYVRQGIKMLTKMIREHEKAGDTVDAEIAQGKLPRIALPTSPPPAR